MTCIPQVNVNPDCLDLRYALRKAREEMLQTIDEDEVRHWCQWAAVRMVKECLALTGSEAVFRNRYPAKAADFSEVKRLIQEPSSHIGRLLPLLKQFGNWLARESEHQRMVRG